MKKLMIALMAVVMSVFVAMPAFAANSTEQANQGSIEVTNKQEGQTYTAYKVFDVTYDEDNYSYTIEETSPWFTAAKKNFNLVRVNDGSTYLVGELLAGKSAATAAKSFSEVDSKPAGIALTDGKAENLALGYYFVTTAMGTLCSLDTTNPNAKIVDKNEQPPFVKIVDDQDVNIGQEVNYTITGKVPDTTGYNNYVYKVTDQLSKGLTLNQNVKVIFKDANNTETDMTAVANVTYENNGFAFEFDMTTQQKYVGQEIIITYSAVVNEEAVIGVDENHKGNPNAAHLEYSNDPTDSTKKGTEDSTVEVYTCSVNITKYKAGDNTKAFLAGAEFKLYKMNGAAKEYYKWDDAAKKVEWVSEDAADVLTTNGDAAVQFKGIEAGEYFLTEVKAPDGFNKLTSDVKVTLSRTHADGNVVITGQDVDVPNSSGIELPSTGDMGTKILYAIGGALLIGAAIALVARKRASHRE